MNRPFLISFNMLKLLSITCLLLLFPMLSSCTKRSDQTMVKQLLKSGATLSFGNARHPAHIILTKNSIIVVADQKAVLSNKTTKPLLVQSFSRKGEFEWKCELNGISGIINSLTSSNSLIFGNTLDEIFAFDAETKKVLWKKKIDIFKPGMSQLTFCGDQLLIVRVLKLPIDETDDITVEAISVLNGKSLWKTRIKYFGCYGWAVDHDHSFLYLLGRRKLITLNVKSGVYNDVKSKLKPMGIIYQTNQIYLVGFDSIKCLNYNNKKVIWSIQSPFHTTSDKKNKQNLWNELTIPRGWYPIAINSNYLCAMDTLASKIYIFTKQDGSLIRTIDLDNDFYPGEFNLDNHQLAYISFKIPNKKSISNINQEQGNEYMMTSLIHIMPVSSFSEPRNYSLDIFFPSFNILKQDENSYYVLGFDKIYTFKK